jgi:ABC-type oligopeptide transport system substrate-binding subunit
MATSINFELDGFGFLDDSDDSVDVPKVQSLMNLTKQQQPPISPIESESSSSGISSLDSDDLKVSLNFSLLYSTLHHIHTCVYAKRTLAKKMDRN